MSEPVTAEGNLVTVHLMKGKDENLRIDDSIEAVCCWEVYDLTANRKVLKWLWHFESEAGNVVIQAAFPLHTYIVSFFAYRA